MYLSIASLAAETDLSSQRVDPQLMIDAVWATVSPADRIEHVSILASCGRVDLGLFLQADSQLEADERANSIAVRACLTIPLLHGWHLSENGRTDRGEEGA